MLGMEDKSEDTLTKRKKCLDLIAWVGVAFITLNYAYLIAGTVAVIFYSYHLPGTYFVLYKTLVNFYLPISFFAIDCLVLLLGLVYVCTKVKKDL